LYTFKVNYAARQASLQNQIESGHLHALLVTHLTNVRYLCGFTGSSASLLVLEDRCVFFSDGRYTEQARQEVRNAKIVIAAKSPFTAAAEWISNHQPGSPFVLGIEADHLTVSERSRLAKALPRRSRLRQAPNWIEKLRMVKDADEIAQIRAAVNLGASLFPHLLRSTHPPEKEVDVAAELEYAARKSGAEGMSFPTIIASGKRSSLPHARATNAAIPKSGFVVCDFGVILAGCCSDMTRTVHVGRPGRAAREFYAAVLEAQQAATAAARPGVSVGEVDRAARIVLQRRGLGKYFTHSTGHGVGLEIHEAPRFAANGSEILEPGMIITVEPGAYIPGKYGVRIEDMILITEAGHEVLTPVSKELFTI
jgi:Xaa-Pro aminopeptidase